MSLRKKSEGKRDLTGGAFAGKNLVSLGAGQVLLGLAQWGTLSVLALMGGAEQVGELAFALAIVTPVFQLVRMRLRDVLATDVKMEWPMRDYIYLTVGAGGLGLLISMVIAGVLSGSSVLFIVGAVAAGRLFEGLSHISYGHQQRSDLMSRIGYSLAARGVLAVSLVFLAYALTERVALAAVAMGVANALVFFFYDLGALKGADSGRILGTSEPTMFHLARLALPLGVISALSALTDTVPRLVAGSTLGLVELGVLAAFGYVVIGASYMTRALAQASSSRVAVALSAENKPLFVNHTRSLLLISIAAGLSLILGAYLVGEQFLLTAFGSEFSAYSFEFVLMSVYGMFEFVMIPLSVVLIAARKFRIQLVIQIASTAVAVVASYALIPGGGIRGAVYALILAGIVRVGLSGFESARVIRNL